MSVDKVVTAIDGVQLKSLMETSFGLHDQIDVLECLNECEYGDMASCNIVYKEEISK